jgi:hypothetical protein
MQIYASMLSKRHQQPGNIRTIAISIRLGVLAPCPRPERSGPSQLSKPLLQRALASVPPYCVFTAAHTCLQQFLVSLGGQAEQLLPPEVLLLLSA